MAHEITEFYHSATAERLGIDNTPDEETLDNLKSTFTICIAPTEENFGARANIINGYRCAELNKKVGGVANSQHLDGLAFDTTFAGVDNRTAFDWMRGETDGKFNINFDQLILEPTWIHVSQKASGNRREVLIAEKINGKMTYRKA